MPSLRNVLAVFAAVCAISLPAWSASPPVPANQGTPSLLSLRFEPPSATLWGSGASQRFLLLGAYSDGLERDVTAQARFSMSNPSVAAVESGRVLSRADGQAVLKAEIGKLSAKAAIVTRDSSSKDEFSFVREVGSIFTVRGCNNAVCHGGVKGKGGFKLSLNGLQPGEDYKWIVEGGTYQVLTTESEGPKNPRVDVKTPEKSLLLLKPTMQIAHGGGERFSKDSLDYQTILKWIQSGAPYGRNDNASIERVEVFPREAVLDKQGQLQIVVRARLQDGREEDITGRVLFESNDLNVIKVSPDGLVRPVNKGETDVIIQTVGHMVSARIGVIDRPIPSYPEIPRKNLIDNYVFGKLRKLAIIPSELSSDEEFLRRICLDVTGTLPPPHRVLEFVSSKDPQKRDNLIELLLSSPEYVDFWTYRLSDLFRLGPSGSTSYADQESYWKWIRESVARGVPYDQMARERLGAVGVGGASRHYMWVSKVLPLPVVVSEQVRVFMGRRLDCAQCHNHPYDYWTQDQFWGLVAFFAPLTSTGWLNDQVLFDDFDGGQEEDQRDITKKTVSFIKAIHPRTKQEVKPQFLDGKVVSGKVKHPRLELARWMTSHPYFAEAAVNRIWSYFFGRGIVNPVDDFRPANPPTHPELLAALATDFRDHGHDWKHTIRQIVQSRTYQLSSQPNETNKDDITNYSRAMPRPLEAEVLLDAISDVTGVPETFDGSAAVRAIATPEGIRAVQLKIPARVESQFLDVFGRPLREVIPERDGKANLGQALHMLVGTTFTQKLVADGGRLEHLLKKGISDREVIEELYLAALARLPSPEERASMENMIRGAASRQEFFENLLWALVSSREFAENH